MTADVVNLRRARKTRARNDAAEAASVNRAKVGRSRVDLAVQDMTAGMAKRRLDGHKLTSEGDGG